jgi:chitinase
VGGATYTGFAALNAPAIAAFVKTFGLDGVNLDFEASNPGCTSINGAVTCLSDALYISTVTALRAALPRPAILTAAAWSIGAFGEGQWANAEPQGAYTGVALAMLQSVGSKLDALHVMSYDAGTTYSPTQAYDAYRHYFPSGDILMGVEVANEAWGGHVISLPEVDSIASYVTSHGGQGLMLWSLQKNADTGPTAVQISQRACADLGLSLCSCPLYCP